MLLSFTVENFRSFKETQTLSMVASNRHPDHENHLTPIPQDENKVLPVAAVYGANGAGKSNLVRALGFLRMLVLEGTEPKKAIPRQAFALDEETPREPSEFSVQFVQDGRVFAYGCQVDEKKVCAEWLSVLRGSKETTVFERATDASGKVMIQTGPAMAADSELGDHTKPRELAKVGVLPNQLFLHAVGAMLQEADQGPLFRAALEWMDSVTIIPADATFQLLSRLVAQNKDFTDFAGEFLRRVETGVEELKVETSDLDKNILSGLEPNLQRMIEDLPPGEQIGLPARDGSEMLVENLSGMKVRLRTLTAEHVTPDGRRVGLPFNEESDGTKRLTHLLPVLHGGKQGAGIYVIDEIDRSLHPLLAKGFVRSFLENCIGSQLVFTTHETAFLDLELLRRDEIWFVKKQGARGASEIYSLAEYRVRTDLKVDKAYLQGRFDAVPPIENELPEWVGKIMAELHPNQVEPSLALAK